MEDKPCIAFEMEDAIEAFRHMDREIVKKYGAVFEKNILHIWDDGERILYRCRKCGGYILGQFSEFHGGDDDDYYIDYFPVSGAEEAESINRLYNGETIEEKFPKRWMAADGVPQWREGYVEKQTILREIQRAVVDGKLPDGFSLPGAEHEKSRPTSGIRSAIGLFRRKHNTLSEEDRRLVRSFLDALVEGDQLKAIKQFTQMCKQLKGSEAFAEIRSAILEKKGSLDERLLAAYAEAEMTNADLDEAEAVKLAFGLLTLSNPTETCRQTVRTLGLYYEFTWYAIQVMQGWESGQDEILSLKQKVSHSIRKC